MTWERPTIHKARFYCRVALIFALSLVLSLGIYLIFMGRDAERQHLTLESKVQEYSHAIENHFVRYSTILEGIGDSVRLNDPVNRDQFRRLVTPSLQRYKGIRAFSWNPVISEEQRPILVNKAKQEGFNFFKISERRNLGELARASTKDSYVVVYFIEPLQSNQVALGYDISSSPPRQQAIKQAFKSGQVTATEPINLVQESGKQSAILLFLPIDRKNNQKAVLVEVIKVHEVMNQALSQFDTQQLDIQLIDKTNEGSGQPLFGTSSHVECKDCHTYPLQFGQRQWRLSIHPRSQSSSSPSNNSILLLTLLSLIFSISVCVYLHLQFRSLRNVQQQNKNNQLRYQELKLELNKLQESLLANKV